MQKGRFCQPQNTLSKENFRHTHNLPVFIRNLLMSQIPVLLLGIFCLLTSSCKGSRPEPKIYQRTQFLLGTLVEIKVVSNDPAEADRAIGNAFSRIRQIEDLMSARRPGTWIERISREAAGRPLVIPQEMVKIIGLCQKYSRLTDGAFDISIGAITRLWQFDRPMETIPDARAVEDALRLVDFNKIRLDSQNGTIELVLMGMSLDLGAAAKGYAVDEAVEEIKGEGIKAGLVNAGGDLKSFGRKPGGESWNIGIQDPDHSERIIGSIRLDDIALVTSGDYERYIIHEGIKYHHILDPKTGWPARGCKSVSAACAEALEADILSTALFVLGPEKGMALLEDLPGAEGMIIDASGKMFISSGWKGALRLEERRMK